ncbi:MAG: EamA family transporter [Eubacteriales bacterium]
MTAKNTVREYGILHVSFIVYSFTALLSKLTAGKPLFSVDFIFFAALVFVSLVLYAFFWQKALKVFPLVKAYSNKSVVIVWNLLWASILLGERITWENLIGSAIIIVGIVVVSGDDN